VDRSDSTEEDDQSPVGRGQFDLYQDNQIMIYKT
jgi:hypothetical protein